MGLFKRVLIPLALLIATSGFLLSDAAAAECEDGPHHGARKPPSKISFIEDRMPRTGKALSERARLEATALSEAHDEWVEDFENHVAHCEALEAQAQTPVATSEAPSVPVSGDPYAALAMCESGMTNANTGNGFYGYFQFMLSTWQNYRPGSPLDYSYAEQRQVVIELLSVSSAATQFPVCGPRVGL